MLNKYGADLAMVKVVEDIPLKMFPSICLPNIGSYTHLYLNYIGDFRRNT